jgi:hypothetical protein
LTVDGVFTAAGAARKGAEAIISVGIAVLAELGRLATRRRDTQWIAVKVTVTDAVAAGAFNVDVGARTLNAVLVTGALCCAAARSVGRDIGNALRASLSQ